MKTLVQRLLPGGVLVAATILLLVVPSWRETAVTFVPAYPNAAFAAGVVLALRFRRHRVFFVVLLLAFRSVVIPVKRLAVADFPVPAEVIDKIRIPGSFSPRSPQHRKDLAATMRNRLASRPAGASAGRRPVRAAVAVKGADAREISHPCSWRMRRSSACAPRSSSKDGTASIIRTPWRKWYAAATSSACTAGYTRAGSSSIRVRRRSGRRRDGRGGASARWFCVDCLAMSMKSRCVVVTGASGNLGVAVVERLERAGARVVGFTHQDADLTDEAQVEAAYEKAVQRHGPIWGSVHCAGGWAGQGGDEWKRASAS